MKALKLTVLAFVLLMIGWSFVPRDYHEYICFHCRCEHTLGSMLGMDYKTYSPAPLTHWYAVNFPGHIHQWHHLGHIRSMALGGYVESSVGGRSLRMNPFWVITEDAQLEFLKSATSVELCQLTSLLAEHRQRDAANLILKKQMPSRVLCDNFAGIDQKCRTEVVSKDRAIWVGEGDSALYFCSKACRDHYRSR